ncbi:MAG: TIR domain-containing protein [Bacteroidaceae bacterium]|nr:TIR domain-containing protein [Prevotella sp.]MBR3615606.1 TIR domain-containing protein [Bacteroidaceae bacterium]
MEQKKYDIFISYSRADVDIVRSLVGDIHARTNACCWVDWKGIESGEQFVDVIINAIDKVDTVLFVLSNNSMSSKFVKKEITYASNTGKRIVPVVVDGGKLRGWFLWEFGQSDYIDINSPMQYEKLISNIQEWYGKRTVVVPNSNDDKDKNKAKNINAILAISNFLKKYKVWLLVVLILSLVLACGIFMLKSERLVKSSVVYNNKISYHAKHACIDLELPSGVMWSAYNIGLADAPEDYGKYYAWGEAYEKSSYNDTNSATLGVALTSISNNKEYDVAAQKWGAGWRMPTKEDFEELFDSDNCSYTWAMVNGKNGCLITSKRNGRKLFLPATGTRTEGILHNEGVNGYYWTSTPYKDDTGHAYFVKVFNNGYSINESYRYKGMSVRPVFGGRVPETEIIGGGMDNVSGALLPVQE